jgi:hypothetical protein
MVRHIDDFELSDDARRLYDWMIAAFTMDINAAMADAARYGAWPSKWPHDRVRKAHHELKAAGVLSADAPDLSPSHSTRKQGRHHATKKKSPAQLEREIAEALSKSGKGHRPSKLGGDYFTIVLTRAKPAATNEWNRLPTGWDSQTRGAFPTKYAAYKWAREKLLPGAPFTIRYVPLGQ